jgi:FdhD protein
MSSDSARKISVVRRRGADESHIVDSVAVEEPLEISIGESPLAVTMRTPGDDLDLVLGFLLTEGILLAPNEVDSIQLVDDARITVQLKQGVKVDTARFQRNMFISSSCGVCGKASIEAVQLLAPACKEFKVDHRVLRRLTRDLRKHQPTFDTTGGLHAAALFELTGEPIVVREDVGRHNAVDKVIGAAAALEWPLPSCLLVVSGRQSFEIVQKAAVAGIGGIIGISAPSSLAVELANSLGLLLIGFARGDTLNVYAGDHHVAD